MAMCVALQNGTVEDVYYSRGEWVNECATWVDYHFEGSPVMVVSRDEEVKEFVTRALEARTATEGSMKVTLPEKWNHPTYLDSQCGSISSLRQLLIHRTCVQFSTLFDFTCTLDRCIAAVCVKVAIYNWDSTV